jgi:hypothetical protein
MRPAFVLALVLAALATASAHASAQRLCVPPLGPGDRARHSADLRVNGITCVAGRRVALACARLSYGHAGTCGAAGFRWRCRSTKLPGSQSTERCVSGWRTMSIRWLD